MAEFGEKFGEFLLLFLAEAVEQWPLGALQDFGRRFGYLVAFGGECRDVLAAVLRVDTCRQQLFAVHDPDLTTDTRLGLAETVGNMPLQHARVGLDDLEDAVLAHTDAELFLQDLVRLLEQQSSDTLDHETG